MYVIANQVDGVWANMTLHFYDFQCCSDSQRSPAVFFTGQDVAQVPLCPSKIRTAMSEFVVLLLIEPPLTRSQRHHVTAEYAKCVYPLMSSYCWTVYCISKQIDAAVLCISCTGSDYIMFQNNLQVRSSKTLKCSICTSFYAKVQVQS